MQDYEVQSGDVSQTMPMLPIYYYTMGMYTITISSSSSESDSSASSMTSSSSDEREDDQTSSHRTSDSGNSFLLKFEVHATLMLDSSLLHQLIIITY